MAVAIAAAAVGAATLISGMIKSGKAKKEASRLSKIRPQFKISPESQYEESLAESELHQGMSAESEAAYNNAQERDVAASIDAMLKTGSSGGNIADLFSASDAGRQKLSLMKDQLRLNQIGNVINSWRNMSDKRDTKWQVNEDAPWKDAAQANAEARKTAAALQMQGISTMGSSLASMGSSNLSSSGGQQGSSQSTPQANFSFGGSGLFSQPNDISGQTTNSPWMNSQGGGSQGWYRGSGSNFIMPSSGGGFGDGSFGGGFGQW